jgi:putative N6-adenine-specific DNA methylase
MSKYELIATTTFGLEAIVKRELIDLGFEITKTDNGKITFLSDELGIVRSNLWLRCADRVLLKVGEFKVETFDELFNQTFDLNWADLITKTGKITVNGKSVKSKLFSISDCQAIVKKAIAEKLKKKYDIVWLPETGEEYTVLISILSDVATLTIDTSGVALHKRGYRQNAIEAPLKETLAAALIMLSYWNPERTLYDVFCGSGTIPIEAAMMGRNIAPGLNRDFASKHWEFISPDIWENEIIRAKSMIKPDLKLRILASDIDQKSIEAAKLNAIAAGVSDTIEFYQSDFMNIDYSEKYAILISNPPYGERLKEGQRLEDIYTFIDRLVNRLGTWSMYILTSYAGFMRLLKRKPDKERKLYNGNIETHYFQFYGPRPPR